MSALAKLYAARGISVGVDGNRVKVGSAPVISLESTQQSTVARHQRTDKLDHHLVKVLPDDEALRNESEEYDYTSALEVLENVNSGFLDLFERLQKSEALNEKLAAECGRHEQRFQQLQTELEDSKQRCDEVESQNADLAERLIAETARCSSLEQRAEQAEERLETSLHRNEQIETICRTLHDGIYSVFGGGSNTQKLLKSLSKQQ